MEILFRSANALDTVELRELLRAAGWRDFPFGDEFSTISPQLELSVSSKSALSAFQEGLWDLVARICKFCNLCVLLLLCLPD